MTPGKPAIPEANDNGQSRLVHTLFRFSNIKQCYTETHYSLRHGNKNLLRAVLNEIDETVLPRVITLTGDTKPKAALTISNRRLVSIVFDDEATGHAGQLPSDPASAAKHYVSKLLSMFDRCSEMTLQVSDRAPANEITGLSCSARSLADATDLREFDSHLNPSLHGFLESVKGLAGAWIERNSLTGAHECFGPGDLIKKLKDFDRASLDGGDAFVRARRFEWREPSCALLPINNSELLTIVVNRSTKLVALTIVSEKETIGEKWRIIAPLLANPKRTRDLKTDQTGLSDIGRSYQKNPT
jgi:hypothetical protein